MSICLNIYKKNFIFKFTFVCSFRWASLLKCELRTEKCITIAINLHDNKINTWWSNNRNNLSNKKKRTFQLLPFKWEKLLYRITFIQKIEISSNYNIAVIFDNVRPQQINPQQIKPCLLQPPQKLIAQKVWNEFIDYF